MMTTPTPALATVLAEIAHGNPALYQDLIARLLEAMGDDLTGLSRAVTAGDWPAASTHVHRIKGSGGMTQCTGLVGAAEDLERALRGGRPATIRRRVPRFLGAAGEFQAELIRLAGADIPLRTS